MMTLFSPSVMPIPAKTDKRPTLALCVGDLAGVGPEVLFRAAASVPPQACILKVYGNRHWTRAMAAAALPPATFDTGDRRIDAWVETDAGRPNEGETVMAGQFTATTGRISFDAFDAAITDAMANRVNAIVTGPIQKKAWSIAGVTYPGHTEVLADRTGCEDFCMMLVSDAIRCSLVTIHVPLADVPSQLSVLQVERTIRVTAAAMTTMLKHQRPARLTVCGLNPHAGENGLMSHGEEERFIAPAIERCRDLGVSIVGPVPPDTAFTAAMRSQTDAYICMYHDQGLIPMKALSFEDGVNVTLGLSITRTSVDHGTAMDIAGRGVADPRSMIAAIDMAIDLCR